MSKKCLACGAPLDGFFAKISALAGVKPSEKNPDYCNKCEAQIPSAPPAPVEKAEEPKDLYETATEPKEVAPVSPVPVTPPTTAAEAPAPAPTPVVPEIKLNTEEPQDMFADTDK
ncbi:MAG: hypothetical protein UT32_C0023G0016 [Parcubacteria group bacterium GW2011_GWC2_39_14]|nr:MAG: hypothetical protein UT32_C0023G0016 [Parcubacteria group bacterium GW2011_GWC2_39_14]KKR53587.1 MAG: hypothetical protein UT91_C0025G0016 [Parcubacteria group bacterium GW2011_GWA2_40_23]